MVATVYGEETLECILTKGLYKGALGFKKDFLSGAKNVKYQEDGTLIPREDLLLESSVVNVATALSNVTDDAACRDQFAASYEIFTATATGVAGPSIFLSRIQGTTQVWWLNANGTTSVTNTINSTNSRAIVAFCQYKDRYYGSNNSSNIFKIGNWVTTGGALTITDLTTVGVKTLLTFRNRMFGITSNGRIYYTDLAAIGGYPETWNLTVNFFDLPTVDFQVSMKNAIVYKDKIYLFTDKGIYYLAPNGDPINWTIQRVTNAYIASHKEAVCVNSNIVFMTDQRAIYAFNGTQFVDISKNMKSIFQTGYTGAPTTLIASTVSVYPYEHGILAVKQEYINTAGVYVNATGITAMYYYDIERDIWTELGLPTGFTGNGTIGAGDQWIPYKGKPGTSWIYYYDLNDNRYCVSIDPEKWCGDCMALDHTLNNRIAKTSTIQGPFPTISNITYSKIKGYLVNAVLNFAATAASSIIIGNTTFSIANANMTTISTGAVYRSGYVFGALSSDDFINLNGIFSLVTTINPVAGEFNNAKPDFAIYRIRALVNTSNRNFTEAFTV